MARDCPKSPRGNTNGIHEDDWWQEYYEEWWPQQQQQPAAPAQPTPSTQTAVAAVYTATEEDDSWLIGGLLQSRVFEPPAGMIAAVGDHRPMLVDSGALNSVTNPNSFKGRDHDPTATRTLFDTSGSVLKHYGKKTIDYYLP